MIVKSKYLLFVILFLAFLFRIVNLDRADVQGDEATYSFRAIGYMDLMDSEQQTTPVQWFGYVPWWSKLSFHDAPPLVFIIQFIFFKFFGVSTFAARLPFVFFGVLTVYLLYLVAKKLFKSEPIALISGLVLALLNYHVWISRTGYLEGILTFFILLSLYSFLLLLENNNWKNYFLVGLVMGLAFMCKYTMLFLIPAYFFYLLFFKKNILLDKKIIIALLTFVIIISPVIFFNIMVFKTRGHLDLQFSQALGLDLSRDWPLFTKGTKDARNLWINLQGLIKTLASALGLITFWFFIVSVFALIYSSFKKFLLFDKKKIYLQLFIILFFFWQFIYLGGNVRFLPIITPFVAIIIGYFAFFVYNLSAKKPYKVLLIILAFILIVGASWEAYNTNIAKAAKNYYNQDLRQENYGFRQLEEYFNKQEIDYSKTLIIFSGRLNWFSRLWYFIAKMYYFQQYNISVENFLTKINNEGEDFFSKKIPGLNNYYFIYDVNSLNDSSIKSDAAEKFKEFLTIENNFKPAYIYRDDGQVAFEVYNFH